MGSECLRRRWTWHSRALLVGLAVFALPSATPSLAQVPKERLRLADLIGEAQAHNPDLSAAAARIREAAAVPARVSALDDPVLSYEAWNTPESFRLDQADNNIFRLAQKLPFPGKRALASTVATRDADMVRQDALGIELDVVAAVTRAYYDLWQIHRLSAVYAREKGLLQRIANIAEQKYATNEVSQADVIRVQVELSHVINRAQTQTLAVRGAEADLRELLSRQDTDPLGIPEDPPAPRWEAKLEALIETALAQRPEMAAQAAAVARERSAVQLAERARLPDFELAISRFQNYGARDGFGAMASVTIPIVQRGKYDAGISEATARLSGAEAGLRRLQDRIRREVSQAFLRAEIAHAQHQLFATTHIPHAEQALQVTESSYQTGAVDFLSLLDSLRQIESVHTEHIQAQAEFEKAYADLERAVGSTIPRPSGGPAEQRHHG